MQIKDIQELKDFIEWAKSKQLAAVQVGEISFTFSDTRILTESSQFPNYEADDKVVANYTPSKQTWADDVSEEDDAILYHSAQPS